MHPFDTDLTSTILRPINSRLRSFFPQAGRGAITEDRPQILIPALQGSEDYFPEICSSSILPTNEALTFFLLPFSNLRAYSISMGQSSTYLIMSISFVILHSLPPPPTLGGGTYAIIGKRSHREFYTCNLHTYFSLVVKILVCESKHTQATIDRDPNY